MEHEPLAVRIEPAMREQLAALSAETERNEEELISEAIVNFLDLQAWQRQRIEQAIAAADRGEFAIPEEVEHVFTKYKPSAH